MNLPPSPNSLANRAVIAIACYLLCTPAMAQSDADSNASTRLNQQSSTQLKQTQAPAWFPIAPDEQQFVNEVLDRWQQQSHKIKRSTADIRCRFFDPEFCNYRDPETNALAAYRVQDGQIRFGAPDKAMYEIKHAWVLDLKSDAEGQLKPDYKAIENRSIHEKWICDGQSVYHFDYENKRLYETPIPNALKGANLIHSPLPFFLFGANKDLILSRYWIRNITPPQAQNEVWLEAYPKRAEDAGSYKRLDIILSLDDFLPKSLQVYSPVFDPVKNPQYRIYDFANRNISKHFAGAANFHDFFLRPKVLPGWKWVKRKTQQP